MHYGHCGGYTTINSAKPAKGRNSTTRNFRGALALLYFRSSRMEGGIEVDLVRDRPCDYGTGLELDLLDEDYEPWKDLAEARAATISWERSMQIQHDHEKAEDSSWLQHCRLY